MSRAYCQLLVAIITMTLSVVAAAREVTRDEALALMEQCQQEREKNIAPLREQAIEDCVTNQRRNRNECESFNRTFGNARPRGNGTMVPGMFWGLPVCEDAVAAQRHFSMNPRSRVFDLP